MIPALRERFNRQWTPAHFTRLQQAISDRTNLPLPFPISETPCFFPHALLNDMAQTAVTLVQDFLGDAQARAACETLIPSRYQGPGQETQPTCVQVDFGIVPTADGGYAPKLVELQAFPSLYAFQHVLAESHREVYDLPASLTTHLDGLDTPSYLALAGAALLGGHDPEHVVLMELAPEHQKTRPDFVLTEQLWGIATVDPQDVIVRGRQLLRRVHGREVPIRRIYNRVIPDELERSGHAMPFDYRDDLDVEWIGHPAWYFRLSKSAIPWLRHPAVPATWRLDDVDRLPADPETLLLKPLFSFAGGGITFAPTQADLDAIPADERRLYLLQERVRFAPVIATPHGDTQAEVRVMCLWTDRLRPVLPLIRMGRGKMMGVAHNQGLAWVGASAGFGADA